MQSNFERKTPILHVSFSSSDDDADDRSLGALPPSLAHGPFLPAPTATPTSYTAPDASITEREILSSDDAADALSLRNTIKHAVRHALTTSLEDSFERLHISCSPESPQEELLTNMKKMKIQQSTNKKHRRVFPGTRAQLTSAYSSLPSKTPNSLVCPNCGHCFSIKKTLNMHRRVCIISTK